MISVMKIIQNKFLKLRNQKLLGLLQAVPSQYQHWASLIPSLVISTDSEL